VRRFNTAGPCLPKYHYMIPALGRLPEVPDLVAQLGYFAVHAPRQTGKTTTLLALAEELTSTRERCGRTAARGRLAHDLPAGGHLGWPRHHRRCPARRYERARPLATRATGRLRRSPHSNSPTYPRVRPSPNALTAPVWKRSSANLGRVRTYCSPGSAPDGSGRGSNGWRAVRRMPSASQGDRLDGRAITRDDCPGKPVRVELAGQRNRPIAAIPPASWRACGS
jgi:hypothetical protein